MSIKESEDPPLNLPVFTEPQMEHWPARISWEEAMQEFADRAEGNPPMNRPLRKRGFGPKTPRVSRFRDRRHPLNRR